MTHRNKVWSLCRRYNGVPLEAAKVLSQLVQRKRRCLREWTLTFPLSLTSLSAQSGLAQNTPWGFMARFQRVRWLSLPRQILPWTPFRLPLDTFSRFPGVLPSKIRADRYCLHRRIRTLAYRQEAFLDVHYAEYQARCGCRRY